MLPCTCTRALRRRAGWKRRLITLILAASLGPFPNQPALAEILSLPKDGFSSIGAREIHASPKKVRIDIKNRLLPEVLQRIQNESGILFEIYDGLLREKVTAHIAAADWTQAVRKLLEDFSRVEVWEEDQLSWVRLLESRDYSASLDPKQARSIAAKLLKIKKKKIPKQYKIYLLKPQLRLLTMGKPRGPIPAALFLDPKYRPFLEQHGIKTLADLKDLKKASAVRAAALKQSQILQLVETGMIQESQIIKTPPGP